MLSKLFVTNVAVTKPIPEDDYIAGLPAVRNLRAMGGLDFHKPVTFFVGENGVGKSTLIEAIAILAGFNAEGGSVNFNFSTHASHSDLYHYITLSRSTVRNTDGFFLRAESFYNVASNIDDLDRHGGGTRMLIESYGGKSLHEQSHGESFLSLVEHRFGWYGLYPRRAGGGALADEADDADVPDAESGGRQVAVHHLDALADPDDLPRRGDLRADR